MLKKTYHFIIIFLLFLGVNSNAITINKTLYINKGKFVAVFVATADTLRAPYYAFNNSKLYDAHNAVLNLTTTDVLVLKIINTDSVIHGFNIKNYTPLNSVINAGDSVTHTLTFNSQGAYIYYDSYQYPKYSYMGAAGMICIDNSSPDKKFYWNLKEHQLSFNDDLEANKTVNWKLYSPDWYTINSLSHPFVTNKDTTAFVVGVLGDTIRIYIANTGQAAHSIHFHGFHCKIIASTKNKQLGWIKDSFPIDKMETMVLELVADQLGQYKVHDNNLMTKMGGGIHPDGMMTAISILKP